VIIVVILALLVGLAIAAWTWRNPPERPGPKSIVCSAISDSR
jgi:hypothetical protein